MIKKVFRVCIYIFAFVGFAFTSMYFAMKIGLTNEKGVIDNQRTSFIQTPKEISATTTKTIPKGKALPYFSQTKEWAVLKEAIIRDREALYKASALVGVKPRTIVAILTVEQLRLYNDNREVFKTFFAPMKVLGTQSQFSWGVVGIKQETAIEAEMHLASSTSPYYLGKQYENLLSFTTDDHDTERFNRIVDEDNRYYSYLYTAIIIKQLETQWKSAGYDISKRPDVISTLFNIGYRHSKPHANPLSGGATITLNEKQYSFGSLAHEFYTSNELVDIFPR